MRRSDFLLQFSTLRRTTMSTGISACGVLCSECGAYLAAAKGRAYQQEVAEAWHRIYGLSEPPENISCSGCFGSDNEIFHTSVTCTARRCCRQKGFTTCAECPESSCALLERAQSVWDGVPEIGRSLSKADNERYARPYCGHRERLAGLRAKKDQS